MYPESHLTTGEAQRWRLIPHYGNGSVTIDGTLTQADECGKELSSIFGCKVLVTQLRADCTPINHHSVGINRMKPQKESQTMSSTTSMAREPRTKTGDKSDVVTELSQAKSLTDDQRAELEKARESAKANGKTAKPKTDKPKAEPKPKSPPKIGRPALGQALTTIRKQIKLLDEAQHPVGTEIRKALTLAWQASADGPEAYIAAVQEGRKLAQKNGLEGVVTASDAAIALAKKALAQQS